MCYSALRSYGGFMQLIDNGYSIDVVYHDLKKKSI